MDYHALESPSVKKLWYILLQKKLPSVSTHRWPSVQFDVPAKHSSICTQDLPSNNKRYPGRHAQMKPPTVFTQVWLQSCVPTMHSLMSKTKNKYFAETFYNDYKKRGNFSSAGRV